MQTSMNQALVCLQMHVFSICLISHIVTATADINRCTLYAHMPHHNCNLQISIHDVII